MQKITYIPFCMATSLLCLTGGRALKIGATGPTKCPEKRSYRDMTILSNVHIGSLCLFFVCVCIFMTMGVVRYWEQHIVEVTNYKVIYMIKFIIIYKYIYSNII